MAGSGWWRPRWSGLLLFLLSCALYLPSVGNGFHYDDFHSIVLNPHIRTLSEAGGLFRDFQTFSTNPESAMFRPVLLLSYALNYAVAGAAPSGYHLVNAILHGLNAVLLYWFLLALRIDSRPALLGALLFAVTPINSEAVNYVSGRSEMLMAFFFLASCLAYLRCHENGEGRLLWAATSLLCGALALLTKSVAVSLVVVLPLMDLTVTGGWGAVKRRWKYYGAFVAIAVAYIAWTSSIIDRALLQPVRSYDVQLWTQLKAAVYYLALFVLPVNLSVEPQFRISKSPELAAVLALLLLLSLTAVVLRSRRHRIPGFACAWWSLLLLPSAVVPLIVLVNEHRLYLAGIGFAVAAATCLCQLSKRGAVAVVLVALYTIFLVAGTLQRGKAWGDELSLWEDAARKAPEMLKPHLRLADALTEAGRWQEAEVAYLRALALRPQHVASGNNLGQLYIRMGRVEAAGERFRAVLAASPDNVAARLNLANLLLRRQDWREASREYTKSLEYGDTGGVAQGHLAQIALTFQRDPARALIFFDQALTLSGQEGKPALLTQRGVALRSLGRYEEAETAYLAALDLDSLQVYCLYNLGNLYKDMARLEEARGAFSRVVDIDSDTQLSSRARDQLRTLADRQPKEG